MACPQTFFTYLLRRNFLFFWWDSPCPGSSVLTHSHTISSTLPGKTSQGAASWPYLMIWFPVNFKRRICMSKVVVSEPKKKAEGSELTRMSLADTILPYQFLLFCCLQQNSYIFIILHVYYNIGPWGKSNEMDRIDFGRDTQIKT